MSTTRAADLAGTDVARFPPNMDPPRRGLRFAWLRHRWSKYSRSHRYLSALPAFAGCSRRQIFRLARWGDVVQMRTGEVVVREDCTDYGFFVVLAGSVTEERSGREIERLGYGRHFGEVATIGFRPQPVTVRANEPTLLFVLGRRHLLSVASTDRSIQHALFPDVNAADYRPFVRRLHEEGNEHWERLRPKYVDAGAVSQLRRGRTGRPVSWQEAIEVLSRHDQRDGPIVRAPIVVARTPRSVVAIACIVAGLFLSMFALMYHPPVAILEAAEPFDVLESINITGRKIERPTGHYLLTAVSVRRPTVAGALIGSMLGKKMLIVHSSADDAWRLVGGREAFRTSYQRAIRVVERELDIDPATLRIDIDDRDISGPSAGLVYALAIRDMLDPSDLASGRVIAATGQLYEDGSIGSVGFLAQKADGALMGEAAIFLVPQAQVNEVQLSGVFSRGVTSVEEAVTALEETR